MKQFWSTGELESLLEAPKLGKGRTEEEKAREKEKGSRGRQGGKEEGREKGEREREVLKLFSSDGKE